LDKTTIEQKVEGKALENEAPAAPVRLPAWRSILRTLLIPALAVFTGLVIGAIVIVITDATVVGAFRNLFRAPGTALLATWQAVRTAYGALFEGSLGNPSEVYQGIRVYLASGNSELLVEALWPITESLVASTPYIFAGLGVALGFRRPGRGPGVPLRPVQHRRRRAVLYRGAVLGLGRLHLYRHPLVHPPAPGCPGWSSGGSFMGGHPRLPQGRHRSP